MKYYLRILLLIYALQSLCMNTSSQSLTNMSLPYIETKTYVFEGVNKTTSLVFRLVRDSIVNLSGYYYSYNNVLIFEDDTIDECYGGPVLFMDSIMQKYEVVNIRKNPMKPCPKPQQPHNQGTLYIIDLADTLHYNIFSLFSFKKGRVKKAGLKRIRIGEVYDMVLYRIDYPPKLTGISTKDWIYVPSLHLNFDRNYCKSYPIVTSPNVIGIFYKCP